MLQCINRYDIKSIILNGSMQLLVKEANHRAGSSVISPEKAMVAQGVLNKGPRTCKTHSLLDG